MVDLSPSRRPPWGLSGVEFHLPYRGLIPTYQSQRHCQSDMGWGLLGLTNLIWLHKPHHVGLGTSRGRGTFLTFALQGSPVWKLPSNSTQASLASPFDRGCACGGAAEMWVLPTVHPSAASCSHSAPATATAAGAQRLPSGCQASLTEPGCRLVPVLALRPQSPCLPMELLPVFYSGLRVYSSPEYGSFLLASRLCLVSPMKEGTVLFYL